MSLPAVVLSLCVASLCAGVFHFAFARRASDLPRYWAVAIGGFALGAIGGLLAPWRILVVGEAHLAEGTVACAAALFLARWLQGTREAPSRAEARGAGTGLKSGRRGP